MRALKLARCYTTGHGLNLEDKDCTFAQAGSSLVTQEHVSAAGICSCQSDIMQFVAMPRCDGNADDMHRNLRYRHPAWASGFAVARFSHFGRIQKTDAENAMKSMHQKC